MFNQLANVSPKDTPINGMSNMSHEKEEKSGEDLEDISKMRIKSRFGEVVVDPEKSIFFPQGLLGLPDNLHFCITDIPKENMGQFKLLQCINDHSLSFVVLPLDFENVLIEKKDLEDCCSATNVSEDEFFVLLIVSVQRSPSNIRITANVRAPIIIDTKEKSALQYVFPSNKYEICHLLNG